MGKAAIQINQLVWAVSHHKDAQMVSLFVRDFMAKHGWQRVGGTTNNQITSFFARPAMLMELDAQCQLMLLEGQKAVAAVFRDEGITSVCPEAWFQAAVAVVEALYVPEDMLT